MPSEASLVALFRKGRMMEISFSEGAYAFRLAGTSRMMAALGGCVQANLGKEGPAAAEPTTRSPKSTNEAGTSNSISSGTGILISESGHVLTNYHVIDGCRSIEVTQSGDIPRSAKLVRADANNDLAVLKVAQ
jgi:S1-C subfamily serine protease